MFFRWSLIFLKKVNVVVNSCLISKIAFPIYVGINDIFLNYICEKRENGMRTRREHGEGGETRDVVSTEKYLQLSGEKRARNQKKRLLKWGKMVAEGLMCLHASTAFRNEDKCARRE